MGPTRLKKILEYLAFEIMHQWPVGYFYFKNQYNCIYTENSILEKKLLFT